MNIYQMIRSGYYRIIITAAVMLILFFMSTPVCAKEDSGILGLRAVSSSDQVTLVWNHTCAKGYELYQWYPASGRYKLLAFTQGSSYRINNLSSGTSYSYVVRPHLKSGRMNRSDPLHEMVTVTTGLPPVEDPVPHQVTYHSISCHWDKVDHAGGYEIYCYNSSTHQYELLKQIPENITHTRLTELDSTKKYRFAIRAYKMVNGKKAVSTKLSCFEAVTCTPHSDESIFVGGDSILAGIGAEGYSFVDTLAEKYGYKVSKLAIPGGTLSSYLDTKGHIGQTVLTYARYPYDYAIIGGGINDYLRGVPFGRISYRPEEYDITTTCGALQSIFHHFSVNYPDTKVMFFMPHRIFDLRFDPIDTDNDKNGQGLTYTDYMKAFIEICRLHNVTIINAHDNFPGELSDPVTRKKYICNDGIHPRRSTQVNVFLPMFEEAMGITEETHTTQDQ